MLNEQLVTGDKVTGHGQVTTHQLSHVKSPYVQSVCSMRSKTRTTKIE